jgi:hypothetical protein
VSQASNTSTNPSQIYQYQYDRFGNRWQQAYVQGPSGQGYPMPLSFNRNNQISSTGFSYDAAGHMITEANSSGTTLRAEIYAGSRHLAP